MDQIVGSDPLLVHQLGKPKVKVKGKKGLKKEKEMKRRKGMISAPVFPMEGTPPFEYRYRHQNQHHGTEYGVQSTEYRAHCICGSHNAMPTKGDGPAYCSQDSILLANTSLSHQSTWLMQVDAGRGRNSLPIHPPAVSYCGAPIPPNHAVNKVTHTQMAMKSSWPSVRFFWG